MKRVFLSRRAFLLGLGAASSSALLSACSPDTPASSAPAQSASSAASTDSSQEETTTEPFLTLDDFPITDGSTACIPLIAQIMADTTGVDLETAQSCVQTNTTAIQGRSVTVYSTDAQHVSMRQ